jgi:hypothetical protein
MFKYPATVIKQVERYRKDCVWDGDDRHQERLTPCWMENGHKTQKNKVVLVFMNVIWRQAQKYYCLRQL